MGVLAQNRESNITNTAGPIFLYHKPYRVCREILTTALLATKFSYTSFLSNLLVTPNNSTETPTSTTDSATATPRLLSNPR